jgi:hypothetical protein
VVAGAVAVDGVEEEGVGVAFPDKVQQVEADFRLREEAERADRREVREVFNPSAAVAARIGAVR